MNFFDRENYSISINEYISSLFKKSIELHFSSIVDVDVVICNSKLADYQCNSAIYISQVNSTKKII